MNDSLGDRMKGYENLYRAALSAKQHCIVRVDGRAFHTLTKDYRKPFDDSLVYAMDEAAKALVKEISGAKFAYVQSDEISVYFNDLANSETQCWFGGNVQKICSISASLASVKFNDYLRQTEKNTTKDILGKYDALFDSRVFVLPSECEVANYMLWRSRDSYRNGINGIAQHCFAHAELQGKTVDEVVSLLRSKRPDTFDEYENYIYGRLHKSKTQTRHSIMGKTNFQFWNNLITTNA